MDDMSGTNRPASGAGRPDPVSETLRLFNHDIRAAMSDVIGGLRLVDIDKLHPDARAQLERVQAAGETLAELVDAALMEAAGETLLRLDDGGIDLRGYLTGVEMRWAGRAAEAGCRFLLQTAPHLPDRIGIPRVTLDRILSNLIGNALKHGRGGDVDLRVEVTGDGALRFTVADQGPGFSRAAMIGLFTPHRRVNHDRPPVSGLGLRIAKDMAVGLGGDLELSDAPTGGAVVMLDLPPAAWQRSLAAGHPPCAPPDLSNLRILVAEDNETNQCIVRQLLNTMGADPVIANDGIEALELMDRQEFDIALVDIEMPRMSGLEFMRAVRNLDDTRAAMPLVALTAYVLRDNREAIYAAGAGGIIAKPIRSGAAFGRAILRHTGQEMSVTDVETVVSAAAGGASGERVPPMDQGQFDALLTTAGPNGARELLYHLREDLHDVAKALQIAFQAGALRDIRSQTHILVSLAGAVGAERLRHLAEALNIAAQHDRRDDLPGLAAACRDDLRDLIAIVETRLEDLMGQGAIA
ncbi:response regulator [Rhodophyticola sp.]|jgi:CheY-like chemotaxis protein|uniref:response regulator n=1 Tax=Rhodophyticola sp. TaxID=2680032 RepID=UPI003D295045